MPALNATFQDYHHPREIRTLRWFSDKSPHWSFVPRFPSFDNPIFERLIYNYRSLPIIREGNWYLLDPNIQQSWWRLETALRWMANVLLTSNNTLLPLGFNAGPFPSSYGYTKKHVEEHFARGCAMKSREGFVPLMALCTFAISLTKPSSGPQTSSKTPRWVELLQAQQPIHDSWIEDLMHSAVADLSDKVGRTGAFIDVSSSEPARWVNSMIRANVPIWFFWGDKNQPPRPYQPSLRPFLPNKEDIQPSNPPYMPDAALLKIRLLHGSRQKPGETWKEYFRRVQVIRSDRLQRESTEQKLRCDAREETSKLFRTPTRKGAAVFYWEEHISGFRIRSRVAHKDVYELWGNYANSQKRYDGLVDEWDVCTEFDPDAVAPNNSDEDDDYQDTPFEAQQLQGTIPDAIVWQEVNLNYEPESASTAVENTQAFDDIVRYRYGVCIPPGLYPGIHLTNRPEWKEIRRIIGNERAELQDRRLQEATRDIVQCLLDVGKGLVTTIPSLLWDLNQHNHWYLYNRTELVTSIQKKNTDQGVIYLIRTNKLPAANNVQWALVLEDPATALECLRRHWGPHFVDIANQLCSRGHPFSTCIPGPSPIAQPRPPIISLGYRSKGYIPLPCDYAAYEGLRNKFLATPRGRAALLKGGIIWRLAREIIPEVAVLTGPSSEASTTGQALACEGQYLWDDQLSEEELDLISGVYKVYTGTFSAFQVDRLVVLIWLR